MRSAERPIHNSKSGKAVGCKSCSILPTLSINLDISVKGLGQFGAKATIQAGELSIVNNRLTEFTKIHIFA